VRLSGLLFYRHCSVPVLRAYRLYFAVVSGLAVVWLLHALTFPPGYGRPPLSAPNWLVNGLAAVTNATSLPTAVAALAMLALAPFAWRRAEGSRWLLAIYALTPLIYLYGLLYYLLWLYD
jgi:hypothetical protein